MNVYRDSVIPFTQFGGTTMSPEFTNFNGEESWIAIFIGEGGISRQMSIPEGNYHPTVWRMPITGGLITSRNRIIGASTLTSNGNLGYQITAAITGQGQISNALGSLIVNLIASISGTGEISNAAIQAFLFATAELIGNGEISDAELLGIGMLIALLEGEGIIDPTLTGAGELNCEIKSYSELSVEGLRDAIWNAVADRYIDNASMGGKLNAASAGGVDYQSLANAILDAVLTGHNVSDSVAKTLKDIKDKSNDDVLSAITTAKESIKGHDDRDNTEIYDQIDVAQQAIQDDIADLPTAQDVRTEIDSNSTKLQNVKNKTDMIPGLF